MSLKTTIIYSPNFDSKKRKKNQIKLIVFHYTGMKKEKEAIKKLTTIQSEVSAHYFIKKNGTIIQMVPDSYVAWHAGVSKWGSYNSINKNSIGIEISNPGHKFGYIDFSNKQIKSLIKLTKILIKKYKIKKKFIVGHADVAPDRKIDPGEKFPWQLMYKNNISIWHNISKKKLTSLREKKIFIKQNLLFFKNLKQIGYSNKSVFIKNQLKLNKLLIKNFQRRFRPDLVNGKIDQECVLIAEKLANIYS